MKVGELSHLLRSYDPGIIVEICIDGVYGHRHLPIERVNRLQGTVFVHSEELGASPRRGVDAEIEASDPPAAHTAAGDWKPIGHEIILPGRWELPVLAEGETLPVLSTEFLRLTVQSGPGGSFQLEQPYGCDARGAPQWERVDARDTARALLETLALLVYGVRAESTETQSGE